MEVAASEVRGAPEAAVPRAREVYFTEALQEALAEEMRRDPEVFLLGEDIGVYGGCFGVTRGLLAEFGPERVRDTPISEAALVGMAVGAAILGARPVVEVMFMDFVTLAMDQLVNHAAKFRYVYGEQARVPLVLRCPAGAGRAYGATHSQSLEAWFLHVPGLKVVAPATAADAKGLLKSAIRDDNPVIFIENKVLYQSRERIPEGEYAIPLGQARRVCEGGDVTLVAYSRMAREAERAAVLLAEEGVSAEVIDLRTLAPLDIGTVVESVAKTGRVVLVEEGTRTGGACAEIGVQIFEHAWDSLDAPIRRVTTPDIPIPFAPELEAAVIPAAADIAAAARALVET
ncbi:MAG: alpha-ketoacid dehydrogenase subunit beta [Armatimonadetes bacterium]|nr:alpha-ketoacid dehydrogenase subunit beta [Armatimonadota bacterium]